VRKAIDLWRARCPEPGRKRPHVPWDAGVRESHWRRRFTRTIGCAYTRSRKTGNCISSYVSGAPEELLHCKKEAHPTEMQAQLGHSDIRTTLDIYAQITDPEVARMVNQVTNRILGLGEEVEPGSVQLDGHGNSKPTASLIN
jgi:hypothetical protein